MKPLHLPYLILKTLAVCYCWHCHCRFVNLDTTQGLFFSFLQTPWSHVHPKAFPFQANCRLMLCTSIFSISSSLTVKTTRILFSSFLLPVFLFFLLNGDESQCLWNSCPTLLKFCMSSHFLLLNLRRYSYRLRLCMISPCPTSLSLSQNMLPLCLSLKYSQLQRFPSLPC